MTLLSRSRPPPIGCVDWPSGRVLLQLLLDDGGMKLVDETVTVLEIGSGIGTTAIGLALAAQQQSSSSFRIVATDVCEQSLSVLQSNAKANGIDAPLLQASSWDASMGASALASCPVAPSQITHVIAADVVYSGGVDSTDNDRGGLAETLATLLSVQPGASVKLLLVDRFSGGAIAAVATQAGVAHESCTVDPALVSFRRRCNAHGLDVTWAPLPEAVARQVSDAQMPWTRLLWWIAGFWEGFQVYTVSKRKSGHE